MEVIKFRIMKDLILIITIFLVTTFSSINAQNKIMVIDGNSDWVDTDYYFNEENPGFVFASGYVVRNKYSEAFHNYATPSGRAFANWNPNAFPCQTCGATSLIGKVGRNGTPFLIGERAYINKTGKLYLRTNDTPLYDNRGAFVAVIYKNLSGICSDPKSLNFEKMMDEEFGDHKLIETKSDDFSKKETHYNFYPNPAKSQLKIEFVNVFKNSRIGNIRLFSSNGLKVYEKMYNHKQNGKHQIDISSNDTGTYLLSIKING